MSFVIMDKDQEYNNGKFSNDQEVIISKKTLPYRIFMAKVRDMGFSSHKKIELVFVIKGSIKIEVRDHSCVLNKGDFYIIPSNNPHKIFPEIQDNITMVFQICPDYLENNFGIPKDIIFLKDITSIEMKEKVVNSLGFLYLENLNNEIDYNVNIKYLKCLVNAIRPYLSVKTFNKHEDNKDTVEFIVWDIVKRESCNITEDMTLEKMALEYNVSYSYLSRMFKKTTGMNFTRYFSKVKLNRALDLLLNTEKTITEIAFSSGFSDVKTLNRDFKNTFKMSPTDFRLEYRELDKKIIEEKFIKDSSFQEFIKILKKEKIKKLKKTFIKDKNYNLDINTKIGVNEEVWGKIIDLDCMGINNLENFLEEFKIKNLVIKVVFIEDDFLFKTKDNTPVKLSKIEINKIIRILDNNSVIPIIQLDFISNNRKIFDQNQDLFYKKSSYVMQEALDFVSTIIGNQKLTKWKFELYIPEINELIINSNGLKILSKHINNFLDILNKRFGENKYNWGLYIGKIKILDKKQIDCIKNVGELLYKPQFYRLDLIYYDESSNVKTGNLFSRDDFNLLVDKIKSNLGMNIKENQQELIFRFNYISKDLELPYDCGNFYYNLFLKCILLSAKQDKVYIASSRFVNYGINSKIAYYCYYDEWGIKLAPYYVSKLIKELKSEIICIEDGCFVTKEGKDIFILLYADDEECYEYMINPFDVDSNQHEKKVSLDIKGLNGEYKITEYQITHKNSSFYNKFIDDISIEALTKEEELYIKSRIIPEMKIKYLNIEKNLKYSTKLNILGISLIKLQKK